MNAGATQDRPCWLNRLLKLREPKTELVFQVGPDDQRDFNNAYRDFLTAMFPEIERVQNILEENGLTHYICTWANSLSLRVYLKGRHGELTIVQSREDVLSVNHHIASRCQGNLSAEDHHHKYDLREDLPNDLARTELDFFLERMAAGL